MEFLIVYFMRKKTHPLQTKAPIFLYIIKIFNIANFIDLVHKKVFLLYSFLIARFQLTGIYRRHHTIVLLTTRSYKGKCVLKCFPKHIGIYTKRKRNLFA